MAENTAHNLVDIALDHARILPFYHQECGDNMLIAGGCCTRVYYNHPALGESDIDMYCNAQYKQFLGEQLHESGFVLSRYNPQVSTFTDALNKYTFQLIEFPPHYQWNEPGTNCNAVMEEFDLSACKLIYMYGKIIPADESVAKTLAEKKLRVSNTTTNTFNRIVKYMSRYQLSLDLEDPDTVQVHMLMRQHLLSTFPPEKESYGI